MGFTVGTYSNGTKAQPTGTVEAREVTMYGMPESFGPDNGPDFMAETTQGLAARAFTDRAGPVCVLLLGK